MSSSSKDTIPKRARLDHPVLVSLGLECMGYNFIHVPTVDHMGSALQSIIPNDGKVELLGHDANGDLAMLKDIGLDLGRLNVTDLVKFRDMVEDSGREHIPRGAANLERILSEFDIPYDKLNAPGNMAHYSMRATLALILTRAPSARTNSYVYNTWRLGTRLTCCPMRRLCRTITTQTATSHPHQR